MERDTMNDNPLAANDARDRYQAAYLADFYDRKRADILASGDKTRIELLREHDEREAKRQGRAAA
jgi:hypothetical protein